MDWIVGSEIEKVDEEGLRARTVFLDLLSSDDVKENVVRTTLEGLTMEAVEKLVNGQIIPLVEKKKSELYKTNHGQDVNRNREKERIMIKIYRHLLKAPYGFDIDLSKPNGVKEVQDQRKIFQMRTFIFVYDIVPNLIKKVDEGMSAYDAINWLLTDETSGFVKGVQKLRQSKKDAEAGSINYKLASENLFTIEEVERILNDVKDDLVVQPDHDDSDQREGVLGHHHIAYEKLAPEFKRRFTPEGEQNSDWVTFSAKLEAFHSYITDQLTHGQTVEHALASYFNQHQSVLASDHDQLEFLMKFAREMRMSVKVKRSALKDMVVFARRIRYESDLEEIKEWAREKGGRVVAIVTPETHSEEFRPPHWFIFAEQDGVSPVSSVDLKPLWLFSQIP